MATIHDIAKKAGVSVGTVSGVLRGNHPVLRRDAIERAKKIKRIADDLGYRPNAAARAARTGKFGAIGLIQASRSEAGMVPGATLWGIEQELLKRDMHLVLGQVSDEEISDNETLPKILREWSADGLLLHYTSDEPEGFVENVKKARLPYIWINRRMDHNCVHPDDFGAARDATRKLVELGHRRIAFVGYQHSDHYAGRDRHDGYVEAMRNAGLTPDVHFYGGAMKPYEAARGALMQPERPTALLAASGVLDACMAVESCGLVAPADLSLMAIRGHGYGIGRYENLSQFTIPSTDVGRQAVEAVNELIADPAHKQPPLPVPFEVVPGDTIAPPPNDETST